MARPKFNRILLKLSGEALMGREQFGIDPETVAGLAAEIAAVATRGTRLGASLPEPRSLTVTVHGNEPRSARSRDGR